ncbi:MAG: outer membrane lipoprotein carrier protein LolA [Prolixibacteraceae bacterium]|jgi:outer membrane lipoprotein-sorting protein|nr:outer membrane lipoprotein carrier protein LolA [Prolixibacteraceae bacterium]MBT6006658.1 outer membrane lipoprotein carrier protein LolA [Prolixibacteraceae bacterium]MBT6763550.1 outer membrane lipoprotein carrier protein LolA [Prolixibacteraceae bacterium]MBT6997218.1 outer membrane lipoprotein carrier protein LolA [Prolixibacteraceae bacterium]MBT7394617.1 outer membrane lipoprotein carrier protein LolA [Prolixibacteraceae bacterium]
MRRFLLISAVLLVAVFASAQQDEKAKGILDKVSEKTRSFKTISADFVFTMQNIEMEIDERNEGSIKLKGQKYCVNLPDVGMRVFSDGTTIWNYMKDGNQVTISDIDDESSELMDPSSLFSIYEKGFNSKFISEKKVGNKTLYQIDLFPDNTMQDISKISISIDKASMMIQSAILYGTDGNLYGIELKKLETNIEFNESDFMFDPGRYGDVEIIDFR